MSEYNRVAESNAMQLQNVTNKKLIKNTDILAGRKGCLLVNDTAAHAVNFEAIIVREDSTQISVLTGRDSSGAAVDLVALYNIASTDLLAGEFIPAKVYPITNIQLSTGSVMMY